MENGLHLSSSNRPLTPITDSDDVEVKKLKDLVKKLEKQNEHLRHRTGKLNSNANKLTKSAVEQSVPGEDASPVNAPTEIVTTNGDVDGIKPFDDNDQDFFSVSISNELSWLYTSPKPDTPEPGESKFNSPQDWLKEEMEHPTTPYLSSAKRNIMYKLDGAYGGSSPDLSYLRQSVEKRVLFPLDDLKNETYKVQSIDLQQNGVESVSHETDGAHVDHETTETSPMSLLQRRGSSDDDQETNSSSGSPAQSHHLPVPSQTMTTAHGLYPARIDQEEEISKRPHTPSRLERLQNSPKLQRPPAMSNERTATTPRSGSPALKAPGVLSRSLLPPSRIKQTSSSNSHLTEPTNRDEKQPTTHRPASKSSLMGPPSRVSRLQPKSGLPVPGASSAIPSMRRSLPGPRTASPMTSQRRSLPRPSHTSTTMKYKQSPRLAPKKSSPPPSEVWGEDEEVY